MNIFHGKPQIDQANSNSSETSQSRSTLNTNQHENEQSTSPSDSNKTSNTLDSSHVTSYEQKSSTVNEYASNTNISKDPSTYSKLMKYMSHVVPRLPNISLTQQTTSTNISTNTNNTNITSPNPIPTDQISNPTNNSTNNTNDPSTTSMSIPKSTTTSSTTSSTLLNSITSPVLNLIPSGLDRRVMSIWKPLRLNNNAVVGNSNSSDAISIKKKNFPPIKYKQFFKEFHDNKKASHVVTIVNKYPKRKEEDVKDVVKV